jgi:PAS domain S-box-containing protein
MTERKKAEQALRQSHDELRAIYDQIVEGVIVVDAETTNPVRANTAFCRMLGYSEEEACSLSPEQVHPPEVLPQVEEHLDAAKQGIVARIEDLPFLRKDGSIRYADVVSSRIVTVAAEFCAVSLGEL